MGASSTIMKRAAGIRLALFDIDGVLTDGRLYIGENGIELRSSNVKDGHGLKLLVQGGITTGVISGRPAGAMRDRLKALGMTHAYFEVEDKVTVFETLISRLDIEPEQVAFMGDDTPDLPLLRRCGLALTVADAHPEVLAEAHWISTRDGGMGAVREACDLILSAQAAT